MNIFRILVYIAIIYFLVINMTYIILNLIAFFSLRKEKVKYEVTDLQRAFKSEFYKPLSIIVPAYNEELTIAESIHSMLTLEYPEFEVVVVNDGSTDATLAELKQRFRLVETSRSYREKLETKEVKAVYDSLDYPYLVVIDKVNGGKADSLNAGINLAYFPLVCNIDADSLIESDALLRLVEPFVEDRRVVAAGGSIRIANDCEVEQGEVSQVKLAKSWLARFQIIEYLRAFLFGRVGWAAIEGLLIISGAFGIFRKNHLISVGGYSTGTIGEDMELVLKLNRKLQQEGRELRTVFLPDPVCWTQVPETFKGLGRQRRRWQQGLGQSLLMNRELLFNREFGAVGLLAYPFFLFGELLGPVIELIGYVSIVMTLLLGTASLPLVLAFFTVSILLRVLLSTLSLVFEDISFRKYEKLGDNLKLFLAAVLESFGYQQLHTYWRLQGIYDLLRKRHIWGEQQRKKF